MAPSEGVAYLDTIIGKVLCVRHKLIQFDFSGITTPPLGFKSSFNLTHLLC